MRVTVDPRQLRDAVRVARRIIPRQSTLPVLMNVLLTVGDGKMTVTSDNLETRACRMVPAITAEPDAVTLNARTLFDVLGALRGQVSLETNDKRSEIRLTGDGAELMLPAIDAFEFPAGHELGERSGWLSINARTFRQMVERAIRSAAPDDARPALAGIQFLAAGDGLTVAATDGFRLTTQAVAAWPGDLAALVPWRPLLGMVRATKPDDMLVIETLDRTYTGKNSQNKETTFTDRVFRLMTPDGSWWLSRTIDGKFPDFQRIVPSADRIKVRATLKADDLRRIVVLARSLSYGEILRLAVDAGGVVASIRNVENGSGTFTLSADVDGEAMQVAVRATFLRDGLKDVADRVTLELVSPASVMTIYATDDDSARTYIMPMRAV
jgi:DNA polymerase-3 subunit beta